jgi:uncharacterized protein with HEPN domain
MQRDTLKHLIDILDAAADIQTFIDQYDLAAYRADAKCRAAVERKLEIIDEPLDRHSADSTADRAESALTFHRPTLAFSSSSC